MASTYTIVVPTPVGVPSHVEVFITAGRRDGKALTAADLAALRDAYPPPTAEGRKAVEQAIAAAAPAEAPAAKAKPRAKAGATKPGKPAAKRAAAKRP